MNLVRQGRFLVGSFFFASSGWIPLGVAWREGLAKRLEGIAGVLASVRYRERTWQAITGWYSVRTE